jgi:hypothetical protein
MHSDLLDRVLVGGTLRLLLLQRGMLLLRMKSNFKWTWSVSTSWR